ncbi:MAG: hypothetical protein J6N21_02950 [Butyrivibrio sp.]|nr:hypothetical protein [Lachnospiraceae bacterium]MBP3195945.1 hypothetical protein [Butyrivibrio sp.]
MNENFKPDKKIINKDRKEILKKMKTDLDETQFSSEIIVPEGVKNAPEILTIDMYEMGVGNDEALGEFYFTPLVTDEDKTGFFNCVITLSETLDETNLANLYEALTVLNFHLLSGSFGVDMNRNYLAYKLTVPYPLDMKKDSLSDLVNVTMGNAFMICDQWIDMVLRISEGKGDVDDVIDAFGLSDGN